MTNTVEIYFSSLKPEKQKELLEANGVTDPEDMNWSDNPFEDVFPIAIYEVEVEE